MKNLPVILCALGVGLTLPAFSQAPVPAAPAPALAPAAVPAAAAPVAPALDKATLARLQAMRQQNQQILEKQAATLLKLEELAKQAEQLKIFSKRG
jgi:hypothetical protein